MQYSPYTRAYARAHMSAMSQKVSVSVRQALILRSFGGYKPQTVTDTLIAGVRQGIRQVSVIRNVVAR